MVKYSVVSSLYNASNYIFGLFLSLNKQTGIKKKDFEIILVDDGSADLTIKTINKYKYLLSSYGGFYLLKNNSNMGQGVRRFQGAKKASGEYIAFIDAKTRPDQDYFSSFIKLRKNTVVGNVYMDKDRSIWDRFNHILRIWLYKPFYGIHFEDIELDNKAYERFKLKGGGGALWTKREYFLKVNKKIKFYRNISDDSMIIGELSKIEPIVKSSLPKIKYLNRKGFLLNAIHTYSRGPKFVDYYFHRGTRFFPYIIILIIFISINSILVILNWRILLIELALFLLFDLFFSLLLSFNLKDLTACFLLFPFYLITFSCGVTSGLINKIRTKKK